MRWRHDNEITVSPAQLVSELEAMERTLSADPVLDAVADLFPAPPARRRTVARPEPYGSRLSAGPSSPATGFG